jgi:hypothetical protein
MTVTYYFTTNILCNALNIFDRRNGIPEPLKYLFLLGERYVNYSEGTAQEDTTVR